MRFGNAQTSLAFLSAFTIFDFVEDRRRLGIKNKTVVLFCSALGFHYFCSTRSRNDEK